MLKKKLIPTPLVIHKAHKSTPPKPVRFRLLYIMWLILRSVWYVMMMRLHPGGKYTILALSQVTTASFERLGGLWIKTAQILAMRRDIFPKEFCDELGRLHDRAHGFPGEVARQIIEEDLGKPIDEVFKNFETNPIAAASIGQVHIAWLHDNGKKVAVKVQRPSIADSFRKDLAILSSYVKLLGFFRVMSWARWDEMFEVLQQTLVDELDYRLEVASMRRMRRNLKPVNIVSPKAYTQYCAKRVLTMEFLDGVLMSDYVHELVNNPKRAKAWAKENDINPKKFGRRLYISFIKQLLEDNLLHGDLHPGNIMMLRKSRIAYIDFGSISMLDGGFIMKYNLSMRALVRKDFGKFTEVYFTMIPSIPADIDLNELRKTVVRWIENWEGLTDAKGIPYEQRSLTALLATLSTIMGNYKITPAWATLRLLRTMTALDASLRFVIPSVDFFKIMKSFYSAQRIRMLQHMASKKSREDLTATINEAMKLPSMLGENFFYQADLIRKRALSFQSGISKAAKIGTALVGTLINIGLIATVFIIARYLSKQHEVGKSAIAQLPVRDIFGSMPTLSPGMWVVVIVLSLYLLRSLRKLSQVLGITSPGTNPFLQGGS
jgi:ubiquinone biosynthesis protein